MTDVHLSLVIIVPVDVVPHRVVLTCNSLGGGGLGLGRGSRRSVSKGQLPFGSVATE